MRKPSVCQSNKNVAQTEPFFEQKKQNKNKNRVNLSEEDHYPDMCEHPLDSGCVNNCRIFRFLRASIV